MGPAGLGHWVRLIKVRLGNRAGLTIRQTRLGPTGKWGLQRSKMSKKGPAEHKMMPMMRP